MGAFGAQPAFGIGNPAPMNPSNPFGNSNPFPNPNSIQNSNPFASMQAAPMNQAAQQQVQPINQFQLNNQMNQINLQSNPFAQPTQHNATVRITQIRQPLTLLIKTTNPFATGSAPAPPNNRNQQFVNLLD